MFTIPARRLLAGASPLGRRAFSLQVEQPGGENLAAFAAERMGNMGLAATDPVEDYRVLAKNDLWSGVLGSKKQLALLDVCSGTGRWAQAFSELVLKPRSITATLDCVDLDGPALAHQERRFPQMPGITKGVTHCMDAGRLDTLGKKFDVATNMHGLYAVPRQFLKPVVSAMVEAVAPGGTCVICLGDNNSFYVRYSLELVDCGVMSERYASADDIADVLTELGYSFETVNVDYLEITKSEAERRHFLENESGGNTWPAEDERTGKALEAFVSPNVRKLIDSHAVSATEHHFTQSAKALLVRK